MLKLGVITDGISRDFEHALSVMNRVGLEYAELQFLWDKEVGSLNESELKEVERLVAQYQVKVSCISRHNFGGLSVMETEIGDTDYNRHMENVKRCIEMAHRFGTSLVRIMSYRKEMILFGTHGAEQWNVSNGAWNKFVELVAPVVELAQKENITLVVETGNNAIITSAYLGHQLIDQLDTNHLKVLWDPTNSLYCDEKPFPDGFDQLRGKYLGHVHMKDATVTIRKALLENCPLGEGQMAPYLHQIATGLKQEGYEGIISLESVYKPTNGNFEDGFMASIEQFKTIFN